MAAKKKMPGAPPPDALRVPSRKDPSRAVDGLLEELGGAKFTAPDGAPRGLQDIPAKFQKPLKPPPTKAETA